MATRVNRQTVDLSAYPDLIVMYLGMRVNHLYGIRTFFSFGRKIRASVAGKPDGLLLHEPVYYSIFPMNMGMRQYWRDLPSLLEYARTAEHREWWMSFLKDSGGTGFWHETYAVKGGMEAVLLPAQSPPARVPRTWVQQELADAVGSVREVVARVLRDFRKAGLVSTSPDSVHILDPAGLHDQSW